MMDSESGRLDAFRLHDDPAYLVWLDEAAKRDREPGESLVDTRHPRCAIPGCGKYARKGGLCRAHLLGPKVIDCRGGCGKRWTHATQGAPKLYCEECRRAREAERMKRWRAKAE